MDMDMDMDMNPAMGQNDVDDTGDGGTPGGHNDMMMMSPFLFTRTDNFFVLFEGANIQTTGAFVGALLLSGLFALITTIFSQIARIYETRALRSSSFPGKILGSALFGLRQTFHYFAMLIVMTMNVWLIIAVVVGHLLGWLVYAFALHKPLTVSKDAFPDGKDVDAHSC
eukprot:GFKZ01001196.1.p2 GENE.GFKZ01001196.1~~GFKZ01001196.1.p2  ORF type:complete len:169 (-),score=23.16 GFKZ01001196.1:707-1213(-)